MSKMSDKHIRKRIALCKALFLAPKEVFERVDGYINTCLDCYIRDKTGYEPNDKFPLDFWPDKEPTTPKPWPPKFEGTNKDPADRAALCKLIFLTPPYMFREIALFYHNCFIGYYKDKTGHKPKDYKTPLDFWINKGPEMVAYLKPWGKQ